jgi:hypothetical protein
MSVFDRLNDKTTYTGMYANHNEEAIVHSDKTDRKASCHAKNFNEAPVTKFGVQIEKPVKVTLWHGLDKHAQGQKLVVKDYRTMDQLLSKGCQMCSVSPQPLFLHSPDGKAVKQLTDLEDGKDYIIIQSGAKYKADCLPLELKKKIGMK